MTFTMYLRCEPTTDTIASADSHKLDVVAYKNKVAESAYARWPWHYTQSVPKPRSKRVTLNCANYDVVWLPPLIPAGTRVVFGTRYGVHYK